MKNIITTLLLLFCLSANAQDSVCYRYIIAEPVGQFLSKKCKLKIDDGITVEKTKENGKTITFKSYAAALMYLTSNGWEFVTNYSSVRGSQGGGYGSTQTQTFWVFRRPSTKEEVQGIIDKSFEPEESSKEIEELMKSVYGDKK